MNKFVVSESVLFFFIHCFCIYLRMLKLYRPKKNLGFTVFAKVIFGQVTRRT